MKDLLKNYGTVMTGLLLITFILVFSIHKNNVEYKQLNSKLDTIASDCDAQQESITRMNEQNELLQQRIQELEEEVTNLKEDLDNEIFRLDDKIDAVEIAKEEVRKTYVASASPTVAAATTSYNYPTEGLTKSGGVNYYGEQKETYYNLNMNGVVNNAQNAGIEGEYWVRDDGTKMYGDYIIVAANQEVYPYGSTVETSLGTGIVLDTGGFAAGNPTQVDIATDW